MKQLMNSFEIDDKLYKKNFKTKEFNKIFYEIPHENNYNLMADLLFLPKTPDDYKYLLVITDIYNSKFDIEPIKNKESQTVLNALLKIFERDYIKNPKASISTDAGTEFKNVFNDYLYKNNIYHKISSTSRHTQQANVESLNRILGKIIMIYLSNKSKETDTVFTDWTKILQKIRTNLNKYRNNQFKIKKEKYDKELKAKTKSIKDVKVDGLDVKIRELKQIKKPKAKYKVGDFVRYLLEQPKNVFNEKLSGQKFRQGDLFFSNDIKKIVNVVFMSSKPYYRYMLEGIKTNSFTDKQLLPVKEAIDTTYNVKSIVNSKTLKNKLYYLVNYSDGDRLWIAKDELLKDGLNNYIDDYETSQLPEAYINMKVKKKFNDGKFYIGDVKKYDKKNKWFKIKYLDGDTEDLNVNQLKKILVNFKKKPATEIRKKK